MFSLKRILCTLVIVLVGMSCFAMGSSNYRVEFPFEENFDNVNTPNLPAGWSSLVISSSSTASVETNRRSNSPSLPNCIRLKNASTTDGLIGLVTPWIDNLNSKRISFMGDGHSDECSSVTLGIVQDMSDIEQMITIATVPIASSWQSYEYSFAGIESISGYLVFSMNLDNTYRRIYLDDIIIEETAINPPTEPNEIQEIVIGTGDNTEHYLPIACYYNYTWSQTIYPATEISENNGSISKLAYYIANPDYEWSDRVKIYMGQTEYENYYDQGFIDHEEHSLVFEGDYTIESYNEYWVIFELDEEFEFDSSMNLVVTIFDDSDATGDHGWGPRFYGTDTEEYSSVIARNDNFSYTDPDHNDPAYGMKRSIYPNIKLFFTEIENPQVPELTFNVDNINFEGVGIHQRGRDMVIVSNSLAIDAEIENIVFENPAQAEFILLNELVFPYLLRPSDSLSLEIEYHSNVTGTFNNSLLITIADNSEVYEIELRGNSEDYTIRDIPYENDFEISDLNSAGWDNIDNSWIISTDSYSGEQAISAHLDDSAYQTSPILLPIDSKVSFWSKSISQGQKYIDNDYYLTFSVLTNGSKNWTVIDTLYSEDHLDYSLWEWQNSNIQQSEVMFRWELRNNLNIGREWLVDLFKITPLELCAMIEIDESPISYIVNAGQTINHDLVISNYGTASLEYSINFLPAESRESLGSILSSFEVADNVLPFGAAWDEGNIWYSDVMATHSDVLTESDLEGNIISELQISGINSWIGDFSAQDSEFFYAVVIDPSVGGGIYKISKDNGEVVHTITGDWANEVSQALAYDQENNSFWISGWFQNSIYHVSYNGDVIAELDSNPHQNITGLEWDSQGCDGNGSLWLMSKNPNYLREIDPLTGQVITEICTGVYQFNGLSFDDNNNFWTASLTEGKIYNLQGPIYEYIPNWLTISTNNGIILPNETIHLDFDLGGEDVEAGEYSCSLVLTSNAMNYPEVTIPISFGVSPVSNDIVEDVISHSHLSNYPNPFNPETTIEYFLPNDSEVIIEIFNIKGQKVKTLIKDKLKSGNHKVVWNGSDNKGNRVGSGVYLYRLKSSSGILTSKMIMMK